MRSGLGQAWRPAIAVLLVAGSGDAAPSRRLAPRAIAAHPPRPLRVAPVSGPQGRAWSSTLAPIDVRNRNTGAHARVRLYANDGGLDRAALRSFMQVACSTTDADPDDDQPLDPRVVQLVVRASYHFGGAPVVIVSATRKGDPGKHGAGDAIDFQLAKVTPNALAAYLFTTPRAGVGLYPHPQTQYVHIDVREHGYHWLDMSPPRVTWPEKLLPDPARARRDAGWVPAYDLPEPAIL